MRYTVTAALPYANGPLHVGHLAGAYLPGDIYARYLRACGRDVLFICGSDEHGAGITIQAKKEGVTPREVVDKYHALLQQTFEDFGVSFDIYSRTSLPVHHETAQEFFLRFHEAGKLETRTTEQFYDPVAQMFLPDRYVVGTCPKCANERAYGDQCEKCGSTLSPLDLINPKSAISGETPELRPTTHWFLPLDRFQPKIQSYINEHDNDDVPNKKWKTNVLGQCKSWLHEGLQARAITRDMEWGVKVPLTDADGKVLYVWFDAPIGYISATKDLARRRAEAQPDRFSPDDWKPYWQDSDTKLVHFIGKDNIVFHCIIFPAILMEHGEYIWADEAPANEFLNLEGDKISTSRNWAIWVHEYMQDFPGKNDVLRYALTATMPETKDADFTWKDFQARNNNELIAVPGNFINRVVTLIHKYYEGFVPEPTDLQENDKQTLRQIGRTGEIIAQKIESYRFREGLFEAMELARVGNKYLTENEPWKVVKTDPARVQTVLYVGAQLVAALAVVFAPFLPETAGKIQATIPNLSLDWQTLTIPEIIAPKSLLGKLPLLFEKIEDEVIEAQIAKLTKKAPAGQTPPAPKSPFKSAVPFEAFEKLDIRAATVLNAKRVAGADKLLELELDTGYDKRTVVSGIAEYYSPEALIGTQVTLLVNLQPKKIKGIPSQGMILTAETENGLVLIRPETLVSNGSIVK